jgi:putative flippase GtrA
VSATERGRLLRYVAVGASATMVHYALLVAAVEAAHWPPWCGSGLGAAVGAQVAYVGNRWFTFGHRGSARLSWPRFQATALAAASLGMLIVAGATHAHWHYLLGQVLATGAGLLLSYAVNRQWTFAPRSDRV